MSGCGECEEKVIPLHEGGSIYSVATQCQVKLARHKIGYETNEEQIDLINCNHQIFSYKMHTEILIVGDIEFFLIGIFNSSFYLC